MINSKLDLQKKSFTQLRGEFLAGKYDNNWEVHNAAMNELHNKLEDVSDLIPLLESRNRHCQYVAAYIAAHEGNDAASIFEHVFPLINSQWSEVRDEACDCFLSCTVNPAHYLALLNLLDDEEQAIRLRVITILFGLDKEVIVGVYNLTKNISSLSGIRKGMEVLINGYKPNLSKNFFGDDNFEKEKIIKVCLYISSYVFFGDTKNFELIVKKYNDEDIKAHYEIYFGGR